MEKQGQSARRQGTSTAERLQMVGQFRRSGLTRVAFARKHSIPLSTLNWWLSKTKGSWHAPAAVAFSEVQLITPAGAGANGWAMEVVGPSGVTVRCREPLAARELARLLRGVRC